MKTNNNGFMEDMPKLESPFIRKEINGNYIVIPEINPGYEWVFEEPAVKAIEKLDGTNVSIHVVDGEVKQVYNRTTKISFWSGSPIIECLLHSAEKRWLPVADSQYFGEAVGDKIQANPLKLKERLWMPYVLAEKKLMYTSFYQHDRTFENWSSWFKDYLFSLMAQKYGTSQEKIFAEGVVFYHPDGVRMAKLRRDMFDWYTGQRHGE